MNPHQAPADPGTTAEDAPAAGNRQTQAIQADILDSAERGDWPQALRLARGLNPARATGATLNALVQGALMLRDPEEIAFVTQLTVASRAPSQLRATLAWRVARIGAGVEALAILLSDPGVLGAGQEMEPIQRLMVSRSLALLAIDRSLHPQLRRSVQAHARRFLGAEPVEARPVSRPFAAPGPRRPLAEPRPVVHLSPLTPPAFIGEARGTLDAFARFASDSPAPRISAFRSVFVNDAGQVWREDSHFAPGQLDEIPRESLEAAQDAPRVDEAILAIDPNANFYHWMAEWLPSLAWRLNAPRSTLPFLVSAQAPRFVGQSLDLTQSAPVPRIVAGPATFVERLYVATRHIGTFTHQGAYAAVFERIARRAREQAGPVPPAPAIYVSRADSTKREMQNEAELMREVAALGIVPVTLSSMPLARQLRIFQQARLVVAPHGAGLTHLLFAPPGLKVIEVIPVLPGSLGVRACFARISWLVGHEHHMWLENSNPVTGRWAADLPGVMKLVRAALP